MARRTRSIPLRPHPASSSKAHASHSRIQLEVESKPQRLEQRSPAIQGGSNWISLAMVKPNPESKLEIDVVVLKLSIEVNLRCENTRLMQQ
ncbi:hypothetical protein PF003_g16945 [Phytophthora fragariae]|nr:hypothetical protein PF003_g16945 [Phytophthora fragariae]